MTRLLLLGVLLAGCSWFDGVDNTGSDQKNRMQNMRRNTGPRQVANARAKGKAPAPRQPTGPVAPEGEPGLVMLVIFEGLRADHASICGYERPTARALETLQNMGAVLQCNSYTSSSDPSLSMGTLLTGKGAHEQTGDLTTLADAYRDRGYQTVWLSSNPRYREQAQLLEGFERSLFPDPAQPWSAKQTFTSLRQGLSTLDRGRPLFLVLNIGAGESGKLPEIIDGFPWVEKGPAFSYEQALGDPQHPLSQLVPGEAPPEAAQEALGRVVDGYDMGLYHTDRMFAKILKTLERQKWTASGARMVVTSTYGDHLGGHGLLQADGPPFDATARVPMLLLDRSRTEAKTFDLPAMMPSSAAYGFLLDGELGEVEQVAVSYNPASGDAAAWGAEAVTLLIAVVIIGVVIAIHPWISGVPVW